MELILLRHALAANPEHYPNDDKRPLTANGIERQRLIAKALFKIGISPDYIISSPRLRARHTAEITATELNYSLDALEFNDILGKNYSNKNILNLLNNSKYHQKIIMLVSHEPNVSSLGGLLLIPNKEHIFNFRESAVMSLYFPSLPEPGKGTLNFFYQPDDLIALINSE